MVRKVILYEGHLTLGNGAWKSLEYTSKKGKGVILNRVLKDVRPVQVIGVSGQRTVQRRWQ